MTTEDFPTEWQHGEAVLPLDYTFEPGSAADGVTVDIPVATLNTVDRGGLHLAGARAAARPGGRAAPLAAEELRVSFVPAPNVARAFLDATTPGEEPLLDALERFLLRSTGVVVPARCLGPRQGARPPAAVVPGPWRRRRRPGHRQGHRGPRRSFAPANAQAVALGRRVPRAHRHDRLGVEEVPREFAQVRAGHQVVGYPALVDEGVDGGPAGLCHRGRPGASDAGRGTAAGRAGRPVSCGRCRGGAGQRGEADSGPEPSREHGALLADCWTCAVDSVIDDMGGAPWDRSGFEALLMRLRAERVERTRQVVEVTRAALVAAQRVGRRLSGRAELAMLPALTDLSDQRARLVYPGFVTDAGLSGTAALPAVLRGDGSPPGQAARTMYGETRC